GPVSVRQAIWHSINTVTVKALDQVGIETAYEYLLKFGFTTLSNADKVHALALGGLSEGVTMVELNAAMGTIANGGKYVEPILYTKIVDRDNQVILEKIPATHQVISESTATMLTDMMEDVILKGTGRSLKSSFSGMPLAGKTGTTSDDKDFLFAGYTPYYTATIWLGHDQPKRVVATGREHLQIWGKIMNEIHKGLEYKPFNQVTTGYVQTSICKLSGKLPSELCKVDSEYGISTDYFHKNESITQICDLHIERQVCVVSGRVASEYCPKEQIQTQIVVKGQGEGQTCESHTEEVKTPETQLENSGIQEGLSGIHPQDEADRIQNEDFFVPQG
ncbi:MAG: penicillin-binding transpeptidase domain-containing protein, partial [Cellulosilyticaceae bacterium]